jgi:RNA polymerase sigma-70 factor, ECF subfamily
MTSLHTFLPAESLADERIAIAHLKQGDLEGLAVLVRSYQVRAVHATLLITGDRGSAEEVVQEAFLRAYRKIDQFDEQKPFKPWFFSSVIHAAIKVVICEKQAQSLEEQEDTGWVAKWLIDPGKSPQELAEIGETREAVWQAIRQLTPEQRAAVVLRYFLDESESEIVRELDRPKSTVKWWLYAARERLRQILRPMQAEDFESQEIEHERE